MYQSFLSNPNPGFPSPADDYADNKMDLNEYLVSNPVATFFVRMGGDSMKDAGIFNEDLLIVDRSLKPEDQNIIVAYLNGDFTVKRLIHIGENILLCPENENYKPVKIEDGDEFKIWGVTRYVIHRL